MKKLEKLNANSFELKEMEFVKGGANGQSNTVTVTYDTATCTQTVSDDGKDALATR